MQKHLAKAPPAQMTSSIADWKPQIIEFAEQGLTAKPMERSDPRRRAERSDRAATGPESVSTYRRVRLSLPHGLAATARQARDR